MAEDFRTTPGILFHILHRSYVNAAQSELSSRGLSDLGSPMILFILGRHAGNGEIASQRELAQILRVSPATIATSLKSLERLGYVEKRPDDKDTRRNRISITPKGEDALRQCFEVFRQTDAKMMEGLTADDRAELNRLHQKMLDNLGAWKSQVHGGCCSC